MKIIRYSSTAFIPQKQTHHIRIFETWQNLNPKDYPGMEYIMQQLKQQHTLFYNNHYERLHNRLPVFFVKDICNKYVDLKQNDTSERE